MRRKSHWMIRLVQGVAALFVLMAGLVVFFYTPWYSNSIVSLLNRFVSVELNEVAAESQRAANLTEQPSLEPGSELWIAQQAYFHVLQEKIQSDTTHDLVTVAARYRQLQQLIEVEQPPNTYTPPPSELPLSIDPLDGMVSIPKTQQQLIEDILHLDSQQHQQLKEKYMVFLKSYPLSVDPKQMIDEQDVSQDLALLKAESEANHVEEQIVSEPNAIVVLGGGLRLDRNEKEIVVNDYTRLRLEKVLELKKQYDLPIVLSGVEAPYMQTWLKQHQMDAHLLEDRSMNTCENTRFSSLLLQKQGGAPTVFLVTDRYHLPRTRRLFALNGIQTIPIEAPMPVELTEWVPAQQNYDHSRRANYEVLATLRDLWFGSSDCREVP